MTTIDISHSEEILTISQFMREARLILEGSFPLIWLEGEISNFTVPHSGHWYFSLKDATSQVKCAMFRMQNRKLTFTPKDGMHVIVKAKASLYEGRGDFQLLIEVMEEVGIGKLQKEFEALKRKLAASGLFEAAHKKPLPSFPETIGVITSPTGAAIRDILSVLKRRYPVARVILYPTLVQGEQAAPKIVQAIKKANHRNECDVVILARGGGSIEDLWPFNEEIVALAIYQSRLPIISGVGHEIDFTIADFVADVRAPTPTAAAELVTPDRVELLNTLEKNKIRLMRLMKEKLQTLTQQMGWIKKHLQQQHPKERILAQYQKLDYAEIELVRSQLKLITHASTQLAILAGKLNALSPLATLNRGYAIATHERTHEVLHRSDQVRIGDNIWIRLEKGELKCSVDAILNS